MNQEDTGEKAGKWAIVQALAKYLGYLILFIVALQLGQLWVQRDAEIGKAPPLAAVDLNGSSVSLADYRGQPLLLYFWASWCPVCRFEHGAITSLAEDYNVLTVALQSGSPSEVITHMNEHDADYRVINDPEGWIGSEYGIRGVPTMFLLDADGNIHSSLSGYTSGLSLRLRLWLLSGKES
jgi:thiol-disulfide isomerase/thioredoxin